MVILARWRWGCVSDLKGCIHLIHSVYVGRDFMVIDVAYAPIYHREMIRLYRNCVIFNVNYNERIGIMFCYLIFTHRRVAHGANGANKDSDSAAKIKVFRYFSFCALNMRYDLWLHKNFKLYLINVLLL